jgi:predicted site-specific integrase-resolvase
MRVAIYARVSTDDRGRDPENQLIALRDWCARSGHDIVAGYVEHEPGWESRRDSRWPRREIRVRRDRLQLIATADRWRQSRWQSTVRSFCRSGRGRI